MDKMEQLEKSKGIYRMDKIANIFIHAQFISSKSHGPLSINCISFHLTRYTNLLYSPSLACYTDSNV